MLLINGRFRGRAGYDAMRHMLMMNMFPLRSSEHSRRLMVMPEGGGGYYSR
jgi:hypothetical protein